MGEFILTVLSSATASGILAAGLVFLAKSWISQRIKSAIEHEYAEKLESYRAQLKSEHDIALEEIKASNAQNEAVQAAATVSLIATHAAAQEKRLHALEVFWNSTIQLRTKAPSVLTILDLLVPKEYDQLLTNPNTMPLVAQLTTQGLTSDFGNSPEVDAARLYAGEYLFSLFWAYRAITGRIALRVVDGAKKGKIQDWAQDTGIRGLMCHVLTAAEISEFDALTIGKVKWLWARIEQKMLEHSAKIISGEASATFGLEQAQKVAQAASRLETKNSGFG